MARPSFYAPRSHHPDVVRCERRVASMVSASSIDTSSAQNASSCRSSSRSALVMTVSPGGNGRKPYTAGCSATVDVGGRAVRACRSSSETTCPAVLDSRRARSLAASSTSSSMSSVVRMHLMLTHQMQRFQRFAITGRWVAGARGFARLRVHNRPCEHERHHAAIGGSRCAPRPPNRCQGARRQH